MEKKEQLPLPLSIDKPKPIPNKRPLVTVVVKYDDKTEEIIFKDFGLNILEEAQKYAENDAEYIIYCLIFQHGFVPSEGKKIIDVKLRYRVRNKYREGDILYKEDMRQANINFLESYSPKALRTVVEVIVSRSAKADKKYLNHLLKPYLEIRKDSNKMKRKAQAICQAEGFNRDTLIDKFIFSLCENNFTMCLHLYYDLLAHFNIKKAKPFVLYTPGDERNIPPKKENIVKVKERRSYKNLRW